MVKCYSQQTARNQYSQSSPPGQWTCHNKPNATDCPNVCCKLRMCWFLTPVSIPSNPWPHHAHTLPMQKWGRSCLDAWNNGEKTMSEWSGELYMHTDALKQCTDHALIKKINCFVLISTVFDISDRFFVQNVRQTISSVQSVLCSQPSTFIYFCLVVYCK